MVCRMCLITSHIRKGRYILTAELIHLIDLLQVIVNDFIICFRTVASLGLGGVQSFQECYHIIVRFISAHQSTLSDGPKIFSWNFVLIEASFKTEIAHKPKTFHKNQVRRV